MTSTASPAQYVVVLTGGGIPGEEDSPPAPHSNDIALALDRAGVVTEVLPPASLARTIAAEAFKVGYHQAAMLHRVVAAYVLPDAESAARFAAVMTTEVDPAYVREAADPVLELLKCAERAAGLTGETEITEPAGPEDH